jgi:tRNA-splicing ligase RtcB
MEVQYVEQIDDAEAARAMGLEEGMITVLIHSGSRGLGYQVCEDSLKTLHNVPQKYGIDLPDKQLVCAPVESKEGQQYLGAMRAAANFAWCNRQIMTHLARQAFSEVFDQPAERMGMHLVYDVAHNIAKMEPYKVNGKTLELCVHRKGATRAFPPGHPELPDKYQKIGQPVMVPGDMGRASYVLVGQPGSMEHTFGSSCHGAGRRMSRGAAIRASKGRSIRKELLARGVYARARGRTGLEEEQPDAYKDVVSVVNVLHTAGISRKVAKLRPIGVIKG